MARRRSPIRWTDEALRRLRNRRRAGVPDFTIAQQLGVTLRQLQEKARTLRLPSPVRIKVRRSSRPWTEQEVNDLCELWGHDSVDLLADRFDRPPGAIQWMASKLRLSTFQPDRFVDSAAPRAAQDARFCAAMMAAIKAGTERVPMIGVDTRACTRNPVFVPIHNGTVPVSASSMADCEIG